MPLPFIPSWTRMEHIATMNWWVVYHMATIHHFLLLFGLFGLFAAQLRRGGALGTVAFVVASLGNALVGGVGIVQITVLPAFAGNADVAPMLMCTPFYSAATQAAQGFIASACAAWNFAVLATWVGVAWLTLALGSILLGIAIARARVLPRWAGALVALGWAYGLAALALPVPEVVGNLGLTAIGIGYAACGWSLWAGTAAAERA